MYSDISRHADSMAMRVRESLEKKGFGFVSRSGTNQQFPILPDAALDTLEKEFIFQYEAKLSENANAVRICTSWATRGEDVDRLTDAISSL